MGWLRKKFKQLKKKVKKVLSTPWGRILGMVGMYFAMGAAAKAFSGWWGSLGQAGTQAGTQVSKVTEIAETSGSIIPKEAIGESLKESALMAKDRTALLSGINNSAGNLKANLLTGSNQAAANSAFSAIDTNLLTNIRAGNTEALNLSNSVTQTVSDNLSQLAKPQQINVQDFLVENMDVQTGFPEIGGGTVPDMTVAEYQTLGGEGPLLAETGTGSSVSYKGEVKPPSSFLSPEELRQQAIRDVTGSMELSPASPGFPKGTPTIDLPTTTSLPSGVGARDLTALSPPSYTPVTYGQRVAEFGKETWEDFTNPETYKSLPADITKAGIGTKVMGAIMGEEEQQQPTGGFGATPVGLEAPISAYVQDLSQNMLSNAGVNINIADPYKTASQLLTQNYTGTANPYFMNQVMQPMLPFPYKPT